MRTLKKSLALVLALVMVLGLAVVGASADNAIDKFEDSDQIGDAYLEAVGVLTGLGIVDGMTDTEIAPQGTYQRDQAAKIIAYMVLGKEAADSLVASYAPFQDVPADYWAAGYIAFCKEQGIIDGVSDTSFDPYGTLTGFQWAKMLLAAVGFNANNELEGDSWSLNTARTGHEVGLFDGDNAGADHVALRREQAMLYAFNTLTNVRQVSYTGNGNNYVYDIYGYEWADGTGYTLGAEVFDLSSVEGQIVDNEATGANATYIANIAYDPDAWWWEESFGEDDVVGIKADTGLDLMYHAVRAWYTGSNTNVYVYDLAEVTTYDCLELVEDGVAEDAIADLDLSSTQLDREYIGADTRWTVPYEGYLIDNTALSELTDYSYVTVYAGIGDLTYRNTATEQTTIDGELVDNDDIKTDISDIAYGDTVVYIHAFVTADAVYDDVKPADGEGWHVYPVTTTEGVVESIDRENGVITVNLTDDTTLNVSALSELVFSGVLTEEIILGRNYSFVLDTHGDVIDLYAFTGAVRHTDDWNSYSKEVVGQFVKVGTTEVEEFSVIMDNGTYGGLERGQYYDISAMTNSDGEYVATLVEEDDNVYADS